MYHSTKMLLSFWFFFALFIVVSASLANGMDKQANGTAESRLGKYNIYSYGAGSSRLFLGHFELMPGGKYRASRRSEGAYYGEGTYAFDPPTKTIKWLSGPYKEDGWGGTFSIEREGKIHRIELKPRTIAINSLD